MGRDTNRGSEKENYKIWFLCAQLPTEDQWMQLTGGKTDESEWFTWGQARQSTK